jgi:phosphohistidine phosphatase SixA
MAEPLASTPGHSMSNKTSAAAALGRASLLLLLLLSGGIKAADESGNNLLSALRTGGYVILMRHASSPGTLPDAAQADADNPQHERQLDEAGQSSARDMGEALHRLGIPIGHVLSSPTYRALETVRLARLGQPQTFPQLGDNGHSMAADTSGSRAAWLTARAAEPPMPGTNTIIVTHFPNIAEAFPQAAAGLADGEALILHPDGRGSAALVARLKIGDWNKLDR